MDSIVNHSYNNDKNNNTRQQMTAQLASNHEASPYEQCGFQTWVHWPLCIGVLDMLILGRIRHCAVFMKALCFLLFEGLASAELMWNSRDWQGKAIQWVHSLVLFLDSSVCCFYGYSGTSGLAAMPANDIKSWETCRPRESRWQRLRGNNNNNKSNSKISAETIAKSYHILFARLLTSRTGTCGKFVKNLCTRWDIWYGCLY